MALTRVQSGIITSTLNFTATNLNATGISTIGIASATSINATGSEHWRFKSTIK